MSTIFTHIYRVRAILALLFLSSASLWAQSDDATLTNITNLEQLHAIRYDLNGDGVVSFTTAASLSGSPMFSDRAAVVAVMGAASAYAEAFASGAFYAAADGTAAATGAVAASTTYYYKLSSAATSSYTGYELMNNLDFKNGSTDPTMYSIWAEGSTATGAVSEGWVPIGDNSTASDATRFTATFEGNGHTISNLYINRPSTDNVGLFGALGTGSNLRNLGIEGGSVTGNKWVGGISGSNRGTVSNRGTISACYATGDASGTSNNVGGLVGQNDGTISACYATGDASGASNVGGLVGYNNYGTIIACYATGAASGTGDHVGGLVGESDSGTISACYATGNASGARRVGGFVGDNEGGTISACYATGDATGTGEYVGGLVGFNVSGRISACYATGDATGTSDIGGLVGINHGGTVTNSYFDSTVNSALATTPIGGGVTSGANVTNVSGKTTTDLQTPTAYGTAMEIYANWNVDVDDGQPIGVDDGTAAGDSDTDNPWDFGTSSQYPALRVDFNVNGTPTAFEFGGQGRAAPTAPAAPSALTAAAANTAVTLNWTAAASDGGAPIINYMLEYDTDMNFSSSPTTVPTATAVTSHTISGLTNGTLYYFRVAAVNSVGTGAYYPGATDAAVGATPVTVPAAPSALMAAAANTAVTLSWTAPTSDGGAAIINYMVEYDTDMNFSSSPTTVPTVTAVTSHTISGLTNATPYYFRVAAVNSVGTGAYYPGATDAAVSATPAPTAPAAPSALMAAAANTAVTLSWTAPTSDGGDAITSYTIDYDTDMNFSSSPTTVPTVTAVTSHAVSGLANGTLYYFRVAAVNSVGTGAYYPGATDAAVTATPAPTAPAAPSALTAMAANTEVTLNWTAPTSDGGAAITGYNIEHDTDMNFSSSPTTVPTATAATTHTVSTLTNATPYYFRVAAVNSVGTGAYYPGATDAAVTATPAPTAPAAPSALTAAAANTAVTLSWTAPTSDGGAAITGYMVEYDTDMNFSSSPTTVSTATAATSHTVSALTNATPYYFRVAAVNSAGTGAYYPGATDAAVSATPAPTAPAAPSALMATAANAAVTLNWTAPTSDGGAAITGYMIEYDTDMNFFLFTNDCVHCGGDEPYGKCSYKRYALLL